jgi:hypothetical protein
MTCAPIVVPTRREMTMHTLSLRAHARAVAWAALLFIVAMMLSAPLAALAADAKTKSSKTTKPTATAQKTYATPEAAVEALVAAAKIDDVNAIRAILGTTPGELSSGDAVADKALREQFAAAYDAKHALTAKGDLMTLTIGNDEFPFAFPLIKANDRWHFDAHAGKDELVARRIGENELQAIQVMKAIVDAERDYASADRNGDGVYDYALKFASSPGKKDGLYWPTQTDEPPSPLGDLVVRAAGEGYKSTKGSPTPYHGYFYRMLKGQTASATGGATDFIVKGHAIAGFAVIAYPAKYASSGIMTFMVNQDGVVYQADLGPATQAKASRMQKFDPGSGWSKVATP